MDKYANMICQYNFSQKVRESLKEILPCDRNKLFFHQTLEEWAPTLEAKIPFIIAALETAGNQQSNIDVIRKIEKQFLFPGYNEYFKSLIPLPKEGDHEFDEGSFPLVMGHNDDHENNIMMKLLGN